MSDDRYTPGPAQQLLTGAAAHVGHVRVVSREAEDPFELSAPQNVVLAIHDYREKLVFALSDGVRLGGYCLHFL